MVQYSNHKDSHDYVCIIGGANIDIIGKSYNPLVASTSNPGEVQLSLGGVGRNIAHNLQKLGIHNHLITAIGKDLYGEKLLKECSAIGIGMEYSLFLEGSSTGLYLAVLDNSGETVTAIAQMDIFDRIDEGFLQSRKGVLQGARIIVVDTNISREAISYITDFAKQWDIPLILDTVSAVKAEKVRECIGLFHTVKPNLLELGFLTGMEIHSEEDIRSAAEILMEEGVKEVVVSLGKGGAFYHDGRDYGKLKGFEVEVRNTTGAGDAFVAGLVYGTLQKKSLREKVILALGCGALTVGTYETVNDELSIDELLKLVSSY